MKKNVAGQKVGVQMVSATDGSAFTSAVTVEVTLDAGTQATGTVGSGACTHEGNGYHTYAPSQAETNGDLVAFTFHGTGAVPATVQIYTSFPQTGDSFARLGAPAGASVSADVAAIKSDTGSTLSAVDTEVAAIKAKTDQLTFTSANKVDANALLVGGATPETSTDMAAAVWDETRASHVTAGSFGEGVASVQGNVTGSVASVSGAVGSVTGNVGGNVTGSVGSVAAGGITASSFGAGAIDAAALATDAGQEIADRLLARSLAGSADGGRDVRSALRFLRNKKSIAAGTLTVTAEDDSTSAWTAAVTTAAGNPISAIDPA